MTPEQKEWLARPTLWPPALRAIECTQWWRFTEEYRVSLPPPFFPLRLVLPVGWPYDRSSIPAIVPTWLISRDGLGVVAPAPHDAGFRVKGRFPRYPEIQTLQVKSPDGPVTVRYLEAYIVNEQGVVVPLVVERATVDRWFHMYLLRQRVEPWRAGAAYNAVRGWWGAAETVGLSKRW